MQRSRAALSLSGFCITAFAATAAHGQAFPSKPIRILTTEAGGGGDLVARVICQALTSALGQPVIIDNRGLRGAEIVAKAAGDGHTLLSYGNPLWLAPFLHAHVAFDPLRDFAPVTLSVSSPNVLVVNATVAATTVSDLIALARGRKNALNFASSGVGSSNHLAGELFRSMANITLVHVPYKGGGAVLPDLLSGRVPLHFSSVSTAAPHVRAGRLKAIAMTTPKRSPSMPEVPTFDEAGLKGYDVTGWYGLLAPAKTPTPLVNRINRELQQVLVDAEALKRLAQAGIEPAPGTPAEFSALIKVEIPKWAKVIKAAGVQPE